MGREKTARRTEVLLTLGVWTSLILLAYGRLLLDPSLHTACPENDTWNLPIRWSVLSSLREGRLPLWNDLSAFGIPWLATWQTEVFYPGTLPFQYWSLSFWNYSGILHLFFFAAGIQVFLRGCGAALPWALTASCTALLNACAFNHLGSNSSMDTMAWMPWLFAATLWTADGKNYGRPLWALFLVLQVFAGYPQILFYTLAGVAAYALFLGGPRLLLALAPPFSGGLLLSACQWLPSAEYFLFNCVRLPAVHDNPHFFLPWGNLRTFWDPGALAQGPLPDYVASPTYFYFNLHSGFIPLGVLAAGLLRFRGTGRSGRFFLTAFLFSLLWALGPYGPLLDRWGIPFPGFFEPAKGWVLVDLFELLALGLLLQDLWPDPGKWKWAVPLLAALNLLPYLWSRPLERNLDPSAPPQEASVLLKTIDDPKARLLVLPDAAQHASLYTPLPDPQRRPHFKRFVPNTNYFQSLSTATFYGSTHPSWGAFDAGLYFQYGFPYGRGNLLDMLGVDYLYLPEEKMPDRFIKVFTDGSWTLWKNPGSMGPLYFLHLKPKVAPRREVFQAFAEGRADPRKDLYLDPLPLSASDGRVPAPAAGFPPGEYCVSTRNALPGWKAYQNGKRTDLWIANGIFQCVRVPETGPQGVPAVDLKYEPASFRLGLFLSLLGCVLGITMGAGYAGKKTA